jgi:hypothetical protein
MLTVINGRIKEEITDRIINALFLPYLVSLARKIKNTR